MYFSYVRVSSKDQNESRQIEAIKNYCNNNNIDMPNKNIYVDKASGKDFNREQYKHLKAILRAGDVLIIKELDRLGRNKDMVKAELNWFKENKIRVMILNIPTTLIDLPSDQAWVFDMINNILIEVLGAIAEEERNKIRTRQAEGIEIAKAQGKYTGRKAVTKKDLPKDFPKLYRQWKDKNISAVQFTKLLELNSRTTLYKYIKIFEAE